MTSEEVTTWAREHMELELADWQAHWVSLALQKPPGTIHAYGQTFTKLATLRVLDAILSQEA